MFPKVNLSVCNENFDNFFVRAVVLCAIGVGLTVWAVAQRPPAADDFRSFYRGAQLAGTKDGVYCCPTLFPDTGTTGSYLPYIRLPSYALMLKPMTALGYPEARTVWIVLNILALVAAVALFPGPRDKLVVALCFSMPVVYALLLGQDIAIVLLILMAAARLGLSNREFLSGMVASLLAIKPTYLLPAGIVFMARSRRGMYGLVFGTAIQIACSFVLEGSRWPFEYLAQLRHPMFDLEPRRMLNLRAITTSLSLPAPVFIAGSILVVICLWVIARKVRLYDALILALPLGMLASPHTYIYDAVVAVPLLLTCTENLLVLFALTPVPYLALMMNEPGLVLGGSAAVVAATFVAAGRASGIRGIAQQVPRTLRALPDGSGFPAN
ncbi:MAG TPA: glycosyltransferase family 87 protein [Bryobacteraceae bacterium]|nr:glycosyltransferase family 87 protein [Bryobacteraceae bacterium]